MENKNVYDLKIKTNTYDVISADTAFYAFMGERLYDTFDRLLVPEDAKRLPDYIRAGKNEILTLLEKDGTPIRCITSFTQIDENRLALHCVRMEHINEWEEQILLQISKKNDILGLYGDYFFEYDAGTESMRQTGLNKISVQFHSKSLYRICDPGQTRKVGRMYRSFRMRSKTAQSVLASI